ncbi:MAG TPA: hypothetical protein VGO00_29010 [Kofleriaceae bacterium]|nr:hypothetical protein [Kofleriaceae bacterium]
MTRAVVVCCVLAGVAHAAPAQRVVVLPADGNATAAVRTSVTDAIKHLAHTLDATVSDGDTTFAETAAAVGCADASTSACANQVLATLAVDEIVYATATTTNGSTRVTVRRVTKTAPAREQSTTEPPDRLEPALGPLFDVTPSPPPPTPASLPAVTEPVVPAPVEGQHSDRNIGIVTAAGGGVLLVIGLTLWLSESSLQSDIDHHPTHSPSDFADLVSLEDRASSRATWGNLLVITGLAAGGVGAYYLWRDHEAHVVVTPQPVDHGAGVSLGGRW